MRKTVGLMLLTLIVLVQGGCQQGADFNNRAFATGLFVDRTKDGQVEMTLAFPLVNRLGVGLPGSSGSQTGKPFAGVTKIAPTLSEAAYAIQLDLSRRISWGHTRVVVIGQDYAKSGINDLLEWIVRLPSFHMQSYVLVAPGKARSILELTPVFERTAVEALLKILKQNIVLDTNILAFVSSSPYTDTAVSNLTVGNVKMISENNKRSPWVGTSGAVLFRNNRMVGSVNRDQAIALSLFSTPSPLDLYSVPKGKSNEIFSARLYETNTKIETKKDGEHIHFRLKVRGHAMLSQVKTPLNLFNRETLNSMDEKLSQRVKSLLDQAIRESREKEADVLGLGNYVEWRYPDYWGKIKNNWRQEYGKGVEIESDVKLEIKHRGEENNPIWMNEG
ncbi:Ger(x)C family spore germination protein [Gorillibacterium massiliense]|uniref:Ger(x)C family spore germination protein n=1 Tax=Gorillibacterium massiliense TaxID=1280390 RepID=UPI0004B9B9DF|nr:Ger(x)C family spore germination protein [Gorillibacterium massiliense]